MRVTSVEMDGVECFQGKPETGTQNIQSTIQVSITLFVRIIVIPASVSGCDEQT
jgi:hypothetical protein